MTFRKVAGKTGLRAFSHIEHLCDIAAGQHSPSGHDKIILAIRHMRLADSLSSMILILAYKCLSFLWCLAVLQQTESVILCALVSFSRAIGSMPQQAVRRESPSCLVYSLAGRTVQCHWCSRELQIHK